MYRMTPQHIGQSSEHRHFGRCEKDEGGKGYARYPKEKADMPESCAKFFLVA